LKKQYIGLGIAVALVIGAMVFLYSRLGETGFAWTRFAGVLRAVDLRWLAWANLLILFAFLIRALRWKVMIRPLAPQATLLQMTSATFVGFTAMILFGRAGEPVRPYLIARKYGLAFSTQVAAWFVERVLDLLMVLAIFGLALTQVHSGSTSSFALALRGAGWIAGGTGLGCLLALVALRRYRGQIRAGIDRATAPLPERLMKKVQGIVQAFDDGMQSTRDPAILLELVGLTVVEWIIVASSFLSVMQAFPASARLSLSDVMATMGVVTFAGVVQIPGVGGGMQIATVLMLTEVYGVGVEAASGIALVLWATNFLSALPLGLVFAFREGLRWRTMRHMGEERA
jgi:glycosyltransferase 2 family protein